MSLHDLTDLPERTKPGEIPVFAINEEAGIIRLLMGHNGVLTATEALLVRKHLEEQDETLQRMRIADLKKRYPHVPEDWFTAQPVGSLEEALEQQLAQHDSADNAASGDSEAE